METTKIPKENGIFGLYLIARIAIFNGTITRAKMISFFSKRTIYLTVIALFLVLLPLTAFCQSQSRSHTVTVIVDPVSVIAVAPVAVNLDIPGGATAVVIAGQDEMRVTDQNSILRWGTNEDEGKVTISTSLTPQTFRLQVAVSNIQANPTGAGSIVTQFDVTDIDHDLITNIAKSSGHCNILYTGIALASAGIGTDSHTLTLTMVAQ